MDAFVANPRHPLEGEVADTTRRLLEREKFPFDRLRVEVKFGVRVKMFSDHDLKRVKVVERLAQGTVDLWFNSLFILQRPDAFLPMVVPHENAHLFTELVAKVKGVEVEKHGKEWRESFGKLSTDSPQEHASLNALFDDRPIKLLNGYLSARCNCQGTPGFHCVAPTHRGKVEAGARVCPRCKASLKLAPSTEIPIEIKAALDYLHAERYST
jgi:predicted SprT family Zn-dependent metalloprotease